jgi:hypothetical protein
MPTATAQQTSAIPQVSQVSSPLSYPGRRMLTLLQEDLVAFHEAHFSQNVTTDFAATFMSPRPDATPADEEWDQDDDGLGYYDDGVKRTLTDEQIKIFRHSELQQLRKAEEKRKARAGSPILDEGELSGSQEQKNRGTSAAHIEPKRKKRKTNRAPREPKPDLRKRTWDVVEAGLDTLDYD